MSDPSIVWFRLDLRLEDNLALLAACKHSGPVIPVFIDSSDEESPWPMGGAAKVWLHDSLKSLQEELKCKGSRLLLKKGKALSVLKSLVSETKAKSIFWNRRYEPFLIARDKIIKSELQREGLQIESFNSTLLFEPWQVLREAKHPYKVFTAFWNKCLSLPEPTEPCPAPKKITPPAKWPESLLLSELKLEPSLNWPSGIRSSWKPGTSGAEKNLNYFLKKSLSEYDQGRNLPFQKGTSRLSPHLHFGEISIRRVWHEIKKYSVVHRKQGILKPAETYLKELGWREFAHHLLYHFPLTAEKPLRSEFLNFPWSKDKKLFLAWQKGKTGYPIVDAGMRELWKTGWMHNRVRMITASFLVKDLMIPWQDGAKWFWDTLVDADLASNTLGWQWTAGCGADAAPYFRIFNPITQGKKFDPQGSYVRKWVPEIERLPNQWIHQPWLAPGEVLSQLGIQMGKTYPRPIVDHSHARKLALYAFQKLKK